MSAHLKTIAVTNANCIACVMGLQRSQQDLQDVLRVLSDADYIVKPALTLSSIGAHMRHMIECCQMLADSIAAQYIDYAARVRDLRLETDRTFASQQLAATFESLLVQLNHYGTDLPLTVVATPAVGAGKVETSSSLGREIDFVLQHTEHHLATIVVYGRMLGIGFPPDLGKAVATLEYERSIAAQATKAHPHV